MSKRTGIGWVLRRSVGGRLPVWCHPEGGLDLNLRDHFRDAFHYLIAGQQRGAEVHPALPVWLVVAGAFQQRRRYRPWLPGVVGFTPRAGGVRPPGRAVKNQQFNLFAGRHRSIFRRVDVKIRGATATLPQNPTYNQIL